MHASTQFAGEAIVQRNIVIEYPPRVKSGAVSLYGILTRPPPSCACIAVPSRAESVTYSISDLAREFALTTRAIRFYEDEGLLAPRRSGRSRIYGERERVRIKLILRGKRLGLSLSEIRELLDLYEATKSERPQLLKFLRVLAQRRAMLNQQQEDIAIVLSEIDSLEKQCRKRLRLGANGGTG
jgi:DNA-binding transcriptional MerR regulator